MNKIRNVLLLVFAGLIVAGCGITAPRSSAGYADLDSMGVFDTDRTLNISLGRLVLKIAARVSDEDDPETAAILRDLKGVRIRIYEIERNPEKVAQRINFMSKKLQEDHWSPVALIRDDDGETMHMLMKTNKDHIAGITLLMSDGDSEAMVVNLMGEIDPRNMGGVMGALDIDTPEYTVASAD